MKITDLRIGNLVAVKNIQYHPKLKGVTLKVTGVQERSINGVLEASVNLEYQRETYSQFMEYINPIQLTEQWLLDYGFIQNSKYFNMKCGKSRATGNPINFNICHTAIGNYLVISPANQSIYLHSVHQLQNLYFAFTQEELILKK